MTGLPARLRKTLTWDQGKELSRHKQVAQITGLKVYFCDPHSPWQRATNEGWPEGTMPARASPAGAAAPVAAPALPSNVVDLALWRSGLANRTGYTSRT